MLIDFLESVNFTEYTKFFIAMIAIVDPLAILPLYAQLTRNLTEADKVRLARRVGISLITALIAALYLGEYILQFFGISLASFRIAGGILLAVMALELLYDRSKALESDDPATSIDAQVVVPIAIPLMAGPGAFSTVIVYSLRDDGWIHYTMLTLCLLIIGTISWVSLHLAGKILNHVSGTAIAIINKVMGLIMAAIAVEFIANGVRALIIAG